MCDALVWTDQAEVLQALGFAVAVPVFGGLDSLQTMARIVLARPPARWPLPVTPWAGVSAVEAWR